jgi:hypothetical protein
VAADEAWLTPALDHHVEVRSADPAIDDLDEHLTRSWSGHREVLDLDPAVGVVHGDGHDLGQGHFRDLLLTAFGSGPGRARSFADRQPQAERAIETIGATNLRRAADPSNVDCLKAKTPPSEATCQ